MNHQPVVEQMPKVPTQRLPGRQMSLYGGLHTDGSIQDVEVTIIMDNCFSDTMVSYRA